MASIGSGISEAMDEDMVYVEGIRRVSNTKKKSVEYHDHITKDSQEWQKVENCAFEISCYAYGHMLRENSALQECPYYVVWLMFSGEEEDVYMERPWFKQKAMVLAKERPYSAEIVYRRYSRGNEASEIFSACVCIQRGKFSACGESVTSVRKILTHFHK